MEFEQAELMDLSEYAKSVSSIWDVIGLFFFVFSGKIIFCLDRCPSIISQQPVKYLKSFRYF